MVRRLVIRADATPLIGVGHVMRMVALAQAWAAAGGDVLFLSKISAESLRNRILNEGFELVEPDGIYPENGDAESLLARTSVDDLVAIDGYHFDTHYQEIIHEAGRYTLVMDDINDRKRYAASILVNQNVNASDYEYDVVPECRVLRGLEFALLRREFVELNCLHQAVPARAHNVLVTFGGADSENMTASFLKALKELGNKSLHVKIITGALNPHVEQLADLVYSLPFQCDLLHAVDGMPYLMSWADLAVGASGSTCWELCLLGVPMVIVAAADNQAGIAKGLADAGAALCPEDILDASFLGALLEDSQLRRQMSQAGRSLVDGKGACRLIELSSLD